MDATLTLYTVLTAIVLFFMHAVLTRQLVRNFQPDNAINTWRNAFIFAGVIVATGVAVDLVPVEHWALSTGAGVGLEVVMLLAWYRVRLLHAVGVVVLKTLIVMATLYGLVMVLMFFPNPVFGAVALAVVVGIPLVLLWIRDLQQRKLMRDMTRDLDTV